MQANFQIAFLVNRQIILPFKTQFQQAVIGSGIHYPVEFEFAIRSTV